MTAGYCPKFINANFDRLIIMDDVGSFIKHHKQLIPITYCPFCGRKITRRPIMEDHEPTDAQLATPNDRRK